jgi:hypothetical protein
MCNIHKSSLYTICHPLTKIGQCILRQILVHINTTGLSLLQEILKFYFILYCVKQVHKYVPFRFHQL